MSSPSAIDNLPEEMQTLLAALQARLKDQGEDLTLEEVVAKYSNTDVGCPPASAVYSSTDLAAAVHRAQAELAQEQQGDSAPIARSGISLLELDAMTHLHDQLLLRLTFHLVPTVRVAMTTPARLAERTQACDTILANISGSPSGLGRLLRSLRAALERAKALVGPSENEVQDYAFRLAAQLLSRWLHALHVGLRHHHEVVLNEDMLLPGDTFASHLDKMIQGFIEFDEATLRPLMRAFWDEVIEGGGTSSTRLGLNVYVQRIGAQIHAGGTPDLRGLLP